MISKTKSQIYNISSKVSQNDSFKSSVLVSLPDLNFTGSNIRNVYLSVVHAEIPNSFYIVNYTNNTIVVDSITYTIPVGNYNANTMITALIALLPTGFAITYSSITNKYTWTYSSNFTINASNAQCKINNVIGLGITDITSTANTLTMPYVVNFLPLARINFRSNMFKLNNYQQSDNSCNVFLSVQNNAPQQGVINYVNNTLIKYLINDRTMSSFTIEVTNELGQLINFNNIDWYLTFQIDIEFVETLQNNTFGQIINSPTYSF